MESRSGDLEMNTSADGHGPASEKLFYRIRGVS